MGRKGLTPPSGCQSDWCVQIGMFKAMISAYETASKTPSIEVLIRLSRLFGVSVDYLVCVDAPKMIDVSGMDDETVALLIALLKKIRTTSPYCGK